MALYLNPVSNSKKLHCIIIANDTASIERIPYLFNNLASKMDAMLASSGWV
jgi:hypothetical protein